MSLNKSFDAITLYGNAPTNNNTVSNKAVTNPLGVLRHSVKRKEILADIA